MASATIRKNVQEKWWKAVTVEDRADGTEV